MILPAGAIPLSTEEAPRQTSRTYHLDLDRKRVTGMLDGIPAVEQAVLKILDTARFEHFIYSGNFGRERGPVESIEQFITEALLQDDRITAVENYQAMVTGDQMTVRLTVVSIFGVVQVERSTEGYV